MTEPPAPSIDLQWQPGQSQVTWTYGHVSARKRYPAPPRTVTAWHDPPSIIVVEEHDSSRPRTDNAAVLDRDGTERLRLRPPISPEPIWDIGFDQVFADPAGLVAVFSTRVGDLWGRPDLHTGELDTLATWR
jgi:hypothetical protein